MYPIEWSLSVYIINDLLCVNVSLPVILLIDVRKTLSFINDFKELINVLSL